MWSIYQRPSAQELGWPSDVSLIMACPSVLNRASGSTQHSTLLQRTGVRELEFRDEGRSSRKHRILILSTVLEHTVGPQYIIVDLMNKQDM